MAGEEIGPLAKEDGEEEQVGGCSTIEKKKKRSMLQGTEREREGETEIMLALFLGSYGHCSFSLTVYVA